MAIEVVYNVTKEWLEELAEDARDGLVDRGLVRVSVSRQAERGDPLAIVVVAAAYSVRDVAVRLEEQVGYIPRHEKAVDRDNVRERANDAADRLQVQVAKLGLTVRAGRLVTV